MLDHRLALRLHDLRLLATASNYDLRHKEERKRSRRDLSRLFFWLHRIVEPDLFIEAGAKEASASRRALQYYDGARVVAFEANPFTFAEFRGENEDVEGLEYLHLALSDRPGEVSFNVRTDEEGAPQADGHGSIMDRPPDYDHGFRTVQVQATTLDRYLEDTVFDDCVMWVDVEGAAESVLGGARETLQRTQLLHIEVEDRQYWEGAWTAPEVSTFLTDYGLIPIARDFEFKYQYNVLFIREPLLEDAEIRRRLTQYASVSRYGSEDRPAPSGSPAVGPS
jgi:FkbM family methyltransferase